MEVIVHKLEGLLCEQGWVPNYPFDDGEVGIFLLRRNPPRAIGKPNADGAVYECLNSSGRRSKVIRFKNLAVRLPNINETIDNTIKDPR